MSKIHNKDKNKLKTLSLQQITTRSNKKKMETRTDTAGNNLLKLEHTRIKRKQVKVQSFRKKGKKQLL